MTYTPRLTNLIQLLNQSIEKFASKELFGTRTPAGWRWTTYREFGELAAAARSGLAALGVGPGAEVVTQANTCVPTVAAITRWGRVIASP